MTDAQLDEIESKACYMIGLADTTLDWARSMRTAASELVSLVADCRGSAAEAPELDRLKRAGLSVTEIPDDVHREITEILEGS